MIPAYLLLLLPGDVLGLAGVGGETPVESNGLVCGITSITGTVRGRVSIGGTVSGSVSIVGTVGGRADLRKCE